MPRPIHATLGRLLLMRVPSWKTCVREGAGRAPGCAPARARPRGRRPVSGPLGRSGSQSKASALGRSPGLYSRPTRPVYPASFVEQPLQRERTRARRTAPGLSAICTWPVFAA
ncbi:hypothetical protein SCALM49S_02125 [Streptomyces californicus]